MKVISKIGLLLLVVLLLANVEVFGQNSFTMPKEYNYNIINTNDNTLRSIEIQNISDQELEFTASSTCTSCFEKIEITPKSIKSKGITKLFFKYDKNRIGVFSKTIKISCSNGEMFYFHVKGEVVVGSEQDNKIENINSTPKQLSNSSTKNSNETKTTQQNTNVKSKSEPKQTTSSNNTAKKYMFPFMEKRTWDSKSDIIKIEQQKNLTLVTFLFINQGYGTWSINLPGQDKPDIAFYIRDNKTGKVYKTIEKESPLYKIEKGWFVIADIQFEKVPDDVKVFDLYTGDPDKNPKNAHFYNITLSEPEDMQNGINLNRILELKNTYDNTNVPLDNSEKEFYISNAKRSNVYTTPRGWQYEILQTGNGDIVNYNDEKVKLNANNCFSFKSERSKQFEKNKTFNSSFETSDYFIRTGRDCGANNAFEIPYHPNRFVPDQQAVLQMHVGDKWKLFYPTYKYTNFTGNEIRVEKEIEVLEIIKAKKPIKKEIEIKNDQIFYLKGDGLNFTEALFQSETYNLENVNVFVIGQIKNTTDKAVKVQTNVNYNYAQTSGAYIFNSTDIQKITTSYYDILQPGETKGFVTHLKLKRKSQGTNAYHYTADLDKKNPYSIETKIVTSIPQENIKSQNELIAALQKNGNVPIKKTDWEELFKKSDANIQAKKIEEKKTDSKSKSIKTESTNKISIEFREIKTNNENCGGFSYRLFDVYKNGKSYKTLKVVSHNDEWWSSCPFDCTLCTKRKKSDYTIKEFLILRHEGDDGKADNYILTEL